jgi:ribosomal protein S12
LTSWADLQNKVTQIFDIYPGSLQLQYHFSNKKQNLLPFDLNSHNAYVEMCDQLRSFIVPKILVNRKPSKTVRKLVTVQLFNKGAEGDGVSGRKGAKVR